MQKTKARTARRNKSLATITRPDVPVGAIATADDTLVGALKIGQAARYLSLSPPTLRRLIKRGLLRANRTTRHVILPISELNRFLAEGQV